MQGFGTLAGTVVTMVVSTIFHQAHKANVSQKNLNRALQGRSGEPFCPLQDLSFNAAISIIENNFLALNPRVNQTGTHNFQALPALSSSPVGVNSKYFPAWESNGVITLDPLYVQQYFADLTTPYEADAIWRIVLLAGCFPAIILFAKVLYMPETTRYTALVKGDVQQAAKDLEAMTHGSVYADKKLNNNVQAQHLSAGQFFRKYGVWLLGTSSSWFLLDVAFYSQSLYGPIIYGAVGFVPDPSTMSAIDETYQ